MLQSAVEFAREHGWQALALAGAAAFAAVALWHWFRLRQHATEMRTAIDHMSQGLCVWSPTARLIFCNRRYIEMYSMAPHLTRRGSPLRDLLDHRISIGTFSGSRDQYIADLLSGIKNGRIVTNVREHQGRHMVIVNHPMPDGSWVATHADITERRLADQQRAAAQEQDARRAAVETALASFRERVESVLKIVSDSAGAMKGTAASLLGSSDQASQRAESAVHASNEASANVETAATAASELSSSIDEISQQLTKTTDVVRAAVTEAESTNSQVAGLAEAAQKIGDVVKLIRDIADQTNLLALNATIEAARAGDAGRGFAVVASEVKSLAVQTAKATEEIAGQILAVQGSATGTVEAIRSIGERMREISNYTSAVAASVEQQNAATGEISHNVASAAQGTGMVVSVLAEVAGAATATRASAETMLSASHSVDSAVANLRGEVESFLGKVAV